MIFHKAVRQDSLFLCALFLPRICINCFTCLSGESERDIKVIAF